MKSPNSYFTRSQRIGIVVLLFLVIGIQVFIYYYDAIFPQSEQVEFTIPERLQKQYDSLRQVALEQKQKKIYPFNPNYLSDYKAYYLGVDLQALKRIENYRKQGKYFQSKQEFKRISGISDSLYSVLEPYIKIPKFKSYKEKQTSSFFGKKIDINRATATELEQVNGIGKVFSKRIIKYRNSIGGFAQKNQLNNVYGLEPEVVQRIWKRFYLIEKEKLSKSEKIIKKDINKATASDLQIVSGIGEKLSDRIVKLRNKTGGFVLKEQLNFVYGLKPEVVQKLWQYFEIQSKPEIKNKINLNTANIKELAENPYIDYSLSKKIISYRTLHGKFNTFEDLLQVPGFPRKKLQIIVLYLKR